MFRSCFPRSARKGRRYTRRALAEKASTHSDCHSDALSKLPGTEKSTDDETNSPDIFVLSPVKGRVESPTGFTSKAERARWQLKLSSSIDPKIKHLILNDSQATLNVSSMHDDPNSFDREKQTVSIYGVPHSNCYYKMGSSSRAPGSSESNKDGLFFCDFPSINCSIIGLVAGSGEHGNVLSSFISLHLPGYILSEVCACGSQFILTNSGIEAAFAKTHAALVEAMGDKISSNSSAGCTVVSVIGDKISIAQLGKDTLAFFFRPGFCARLGTDLHAGSFRSSFKPQISSALNTWSGYGGPFIVIGTSAIWSSLNEAHHVIFDSLNLTASEMCRRLTAAQGASCVALNLSILL